jgi:hypothetical protein
VVGPRPNVSNGRPIFFNIFLSHSWRDSKNGKSRKGDGRGALALQRDRTASSAASSAELPCATKENENLAQKCYAAGREQLLHGRRIEFQRNKMHHRKNKK